MDYKKALKLKCLEAKIVPKGFVLELEPIIGNHNQEFLDNWYDKLKSFSFSMMETIFQFCDKAIAENKIEISNCGQILK